jgi:hypothetical protein
MDDYEAHQERHRTLVAQYGKPERIDGETALEAIGRPAGISADNVIAYIYRSREAAEAYAVSNLEHSDVASLGIVETDGGWLGVTDLRHIHCQAAG